ncbi:MAG: hypothetical protein LKK00_09595 [Intestinimonas sp.]|jgi:hypothetical protein|nr:hypothetical protein [Intestinimonas sp.]
MGVWLALLLILAVYFLGDFLGGITKARISSVFVIMLGFLVLFMTGIFPADIIDQASLTTTSKIGIQFLVINMGSSVSISQLKKEWRTVATACISMALAIIACFAVTPVIGIDSALAAAPVINGGIVATNTMVTAAESAGLVIVAALASFLYAIQKFVGTLPASHCGLKYATGIVEELRRNRTENPQFFAADNLSSADVLPVKKLFWQKHEKYYTTYICLAISALFIWFGGLLSTATHGWIGQTLWSMIFGILLRQFGFIPANFLRDKAKSNGFFTFLAFCAIIPALAKIQFSQLPTIGFYVLLIFVVTVLFLWLGFYILPLWKIVGSKHLAIGIAMCQMIGYPGTQLVTDEIANAIGETPEERDLIQEKLGTAYVLSGFVSVTILSVFIANICAKFIAQ